MLKSFYEGPEMEYDNTIYLIDQKKRKRGDKQHEFDNYYLHHFVPAHIPYACCMRRVVRGGAGGFRLRTGIGAGHACRSSGHYKAQHRSAGPVT